MAGYDFHPAAEKELSRLPSRDQGRVLARLKALSLASHPLRFPNVIELEGYREPTYRLRVGDWRAIFRLRERRLYVLSVRPRQRGY